MTDDATSIQMTPLEQFLTYRLARIQSKLTAKDSRMLRELAGITTTQWRIIAILGSHGLCTAAQLSRIATMDKGLISRTVKSLQAEGLISTSRKATDNRAMYLDLTVAGRDIFDRMMPRMQARQTALRAYLQDLPSDVLNRAFDCLERAADDPAV